MPRHSDEAYGASHTSFYTDAVAKDKYDTLEEVLAEKLKDRLGFAYLAVACVKLLGAVSLFEPWL